MITVSRSTIVDAPLRQVWELLRDFNGHDRWHPAVSRSTVEQGLRSDQIGAVRNFVLTGGERLREQLLALSDQDHSFSYAIVDSEIPLDNYIARVELKPVTDGNRTFWSWSSRFDAPVGREREMAELVAEKVYQAGFAAIQSRLESTQPGVATEPGAGAAKAIEGMAMVIDRYGGPEELHSTNITAPPPGRGEVRLRQTAIGVNFIDIYCRNGYFDLLHPPGTPGMEAAAEVIDVGAGVRHLLPGQRVAYACPPLGAYATVRTMDASLLVPLPDSIDDVTAAAGLLKGMTAEFLLHRVHAVTKGETVLVYAPAGGVGRILCQWANYLGATVIGATSTEAKARIARAAGAHHVILPGEQSLEQQVLALTGGHGADVIYDAVGRDSFAHSVAALAMRGHLISFGQASGDIGLWDVGSLASVSATLSRPNFGHYTDTPDQVAAITKRLFDAIDRRIVTIEIGQRFALAEAELAHRALEQRRTTASTVLIPEHTR